jgi:putative hydrolase
MKYLADTHMHTVASGHAYSTMDDMVGVAKEKGLELIAITDHGPAMPDGAYDFYFHNSRVWPTYIDDVRVLKGIEISIMDLEGSLEMNPWVYDVLEIVIASFHPPAFMGGVTESVDIQTATKAVIAMMQNRQVNIIGHPDDSRFPLDYCQVVQAAKDTNTLLEVNCSSLSPNSFRLGAKENCMTMLEQCVKRNVGIVVGSDAHYKTYVGNHEAGRNLLESIGFPTELIVSRDAQTLLEFLNIKA